MKSDTPPSPVANFRRQFLTHSVATLACAALLGSTVRAADSTPTPAKPAAATLRGQGLASALVCQLVKNCPLPAVQLVCEDALLGFYSRLGFLPVGSVLFAQG